jgi:anti-sigma B factor antagonist
MEFQLDDVGGAIRVALSGRMDAAGVDRIEPRLLAGIVHGGKNVAVDLAGVDFVSSLGIRMLLGAAKALQPRSAKLVLYGARPLVAESLNLAVKGLIPLVADESQALALLAA